MTTYNINEFKSFGEALAKLEAYDTLELEDQIIKEAIIINKPVHIIGKQATYEIGLHQMMINSTSVTFEGIIFDFTPEKESGLLISDSDVRLKDCKIRSKSQDSDFYASILTEASSLTLLSCQLDLQANLLKALHGSLFELIECNLNVLSGVDVCIETQGVKKITMHHNKIETSIALLRSKKISEFMISKNEFKVTSALKDVTKLITFDGFNPGDMTCILEENTILSEQHIELHIRNNQSSTRSIKLLKNKYEGLNNRFLLHLHRLIGPVQLDNNKFLNRNVVYIDYCQEVINRKNRFNDFILDQIQHGIIIEHVIKGLSHFEKVSTLELKKNIFINDDKDQELIKCIGIEKLQFTYNKLCSVDHGLAFENTGHTQHIDISKNDFSKCKKTGIKIYDALHEKFLKTTVSFNQNIFMNNNRSISVLDKYLEQLIINDNYFDDNVYHLEVSGGKFTNRINIESNYFGDGIVKLGGCRLCEISYNELTTSKMSLWGIEDISITRNQYQGHPKHKDHGIRIKSGGRVNITDNYMLSQLKQEKRTISQMFSISAYEKKPALFIEHNHLRLGVEKKGMFGFKGKATEPIVLPNKTLYSRLQHNLKYDEVDDSIKRDIFTDDLTLDEVMEKEFNDLKDAFIKMEKDMISNTLKPLMHNLVGKFKIQMLSGKETNDVYRFLSKAKEVKAMIEIYMALDDDHLEPVTQKRIKGILTQYISVLDGFTEAIEAQEQDQLNAQLNLLENIL